MEGFLIIDMNTTGIQIEGLGLIRHPFIKLPILSQLQESHFFKEWVDINLRLNGGKAMV
jgi:hypothetical protein